MKKALIIANMMFASVTSWGMMPNDNSAQQTGNRGSVFNMSDIKKEIEEIGKIKTKFKVEDYIEPSIEESSNSLCDAILQPDFEKVKRLVCKKADRSSVLGLILAHSNYRKYNKKMPNALFLKYHNLIFRSPDIKLVNFPYEGGETPLHTAAYDRNEDIVKYLINHGAEIDKPTDNGFTPLYTAIFSFVSEGFSEFILEGCTMEGIIEGFERGGILLDADAANNIREGIIERDKCCNVIKVLLENGANANAVTHDFTLFMFAWEGNFYNAMESLIEYGADVNVIPLADVILKGYSVAFIEYLIDHGADVNKTNADGESPLNAAIQINNPELATYLVKTLLENGADVNVEGYRRTTALTSASYLGREDIVRYLVNHGADVNKGGCVGDTPLYMAAQEGHNDIVVLLTKFGADISKKNDDGCTPLRVAAQEGHKDIVVLLTELGANIEEMDNDGNTPLLGAAARGHADIVQYLIDQNAKIDVERSDGITPLWIAAQNGHENIVKMLAERGADIEKRNIYGIAPLEIAVAKKKQNIVKYLVRILMPEAVQKYGYERVLLSFVSNLMPKFLQENGYETTMKHLIRMLRQ